MASPGERTIQDFGDQWTRYPTNEGYYASIDLFKDFCGPLININEIAGKTALEVGSGTGRIVKMLLDAGVKKVIAVEPSRAFEALLINTKPWADKIQYLHIKGEKIPNLHVDYAFSIGVLHHIPDPKPVIQRVYKALKPGGKFLIWVYGLEGNEMYLKLFLPLRKITSKMPDLLLAGFAHCLNFCLSIYLFFCKFLPIPLYKYARGVLLKLDRKSRFLIIFDQLNPAYAHYYPRPEAEKLLSSANFVNIKSYHRHAYSWAVVGEK